MLYDNRITCVDCLIINFNKILRIFCFTIKVRLIDFNISNYLKKLHKFFIVCNFKVVIIKDTRFNVY